MSRRLANATYPIQTCEQLEVSNLKMLVRGLLVRCPACGSGHTHRSWSKMRERCEQCSLKFRRIEGHELGYIGLNTVVTFATTFAVLLGMSLAMIPDINVSLMAMVIPIPAVLLPVAFLPSSHTMWTAIDLIMRALNPGEIDPRFIKVDPEAGRWKVPEAAINAVDPETPPT